MKEIIAAVVFASMIGATAVAQVPQGARGGIPGAPNRGGATHAGSVIMLCATAPVVTQLGTEPAPAPAAAPGLPRWHVECVTETTPAPAPTPAPTPAR